MEVILLIDDDIELCSMLTEYLGENGFQVETAHGADTGLALAQERAWTLILLDLMLPETNGLEVLKKIREHSDVSVLLLTAHEEDADCISGLEAGADDYLAKPFNPRELLARMRAVLRRNSGPAPPESGTLHVQDLELDPAARLVLRKGNRIGLTDVEFNLLEVLMRSPGKVVTRDDLSEKVLGRRFDPYDRSLDMHVSRLRRKLAQEGAPEDQVKTIRGIGYQLLVNRHLAPSQSEG